MPRPVRFVAGSSWPPAPSARPSVAFSAAAAKTLAIPRANGKNATVWDKCNWRVTGMIGLVRLALRRPYTSAIAAMLIVLMGALSITRMIVDIFPVIDIPVVLVVWNYNGLTTEDMERRVVFISERAYSTTVNGISRIEFPIAPQHRHAEGVFPAGNRYWRRDRADQFSEQLHPARRAARHATAGRDPVQRLQRSRRADDAVEQDAERAADLRLQPELHPHSALYDPRSVHARTVRRQAAADQCRPRPVAPAGKGLLAHRRRQRAAGIKCHNSGRDSAHRRAQPTTSS